MKYCQKCGSENTEEAKFCATCGSPMSVKKSVFCPQCGQQLEGDSKFCHNCGKDVSKITGFTGPVNPTPPPPTPITPGGTEILGQYTSNDLIGGRYRVIKKIGQGGFAATYLVEHSNFGEKLVLKEIIHSSNKGRELFDREARECHFFCVNSFFTNSLFLQNESQTDSLLPPNVVSALSTFLMH